MRGWRVVGVALVAGLAALMLVVLATGLLTATPRGVEDNGDGYRLTCSAGLTPATVDELGSWKGGVVTTFTRSAACADRQPSSAWVVLKASTIGHPRTWSLTTLGWWYAALVAVVAALAAGAAGAAAARGPARAAVVAVPLAPLALPAFSRFFVSVYSEPAGLLGTVAAGCGVAVLAVTRAQDRAARGVALALLAGGGLVAGTAKLAFVPVLVLALLVVGGTAVGTRRRRVVGPVVALVAAAVALVPLGAALDRQSTQYAAANTHDLVFTVVSRELGPGVLPALGLPPQAAAADGTGYFNGPPRPDAPWYRAAIVDDPGPTRRAALAALAGHPVALARAVGTGLAATTRADLPYLASTPADPGRRSPPSGDVGWSGGDRPAFDTVLDATRRPPWVPTGVIVVAFGAGLAALVDRRRRVVGAPWRRWCGGAASAAGGALVLVVGAVLGDGFFELFKHVWLAAYLLAVAALCLLGAAVSLVVGRVGLRGRARGEATQGVVAHDDHDRAERDARELTSADVERHAADPDDDARGQRHQDLGA